MNICSAAKNSFASHGMSWHLQMSSVSYKRLTFASVHSLQLDSLLLVSLTLENDALFCIQKAPVFGESGCTTGCTSGPGSAIPIATHALLIYLYRRSSAGTISKTTEYMASGCKPRIDKTMCGNIRLQNRKWVFRCRERLTRCQIMRYGIKVTGIF